MREARPCGCDPQQATVVMPKKQASRPAPPPPVPLSQRPLYQQRGMAPSRPVADTSSAAAQQAIAAAQAIAARLAAQDSSSFGAFSGPQGGAHQPGSSGRRDEPAGQRRDRWDRGS
jgi:hypothetical protein